MRNIKQLTALAIICIFALTSCGGAKSKGISQANPQATKPPIAAPTPSVRINLTGKVIDYTNKAPVPGAKLITFDKQEIIASDKGEFTLQVPQDKGFTFRVKAQGYQETLAGGRIKSSTDGVEIKLAKMNSGIFPVTLNIGEKGAKLFKGPTMPKGIDITEGKLYQVAFPIYEIEYFTGITKPFALSYYDALKTHTWQYVFVNADGTIKSGKDLTKLGSSFFLFGSDNAKLEAEGLPSTASHSNVRELLGGGYDTVEQQWNMVGCWSDEPAAVINFRICKDNTYYTLEEAYTQNIIGPPVFYTFNPNTESWDTTSYPDDSFQPYKGYYLLVLQDCTIDISLIPPNPEADAVIKEFAAKLRQNDVPGAVNLFTEERRAFIRGILSRATSLNLANFANDIESAYFVDQNTCVVLSERRYNYLLTSGGKFYFRMVFLIKAGEGNWQIRDY